MKALVGAFNQEKALVWAFSVIVQPVVEPMEHYTALAQTLCHHDAAARITRETLHRTMAANSLMQLIIFPTHPWLKVNTTPAFRVKPRGG